LAHKSRIRICEIKVLCFVGPHNLIFSCIKVGWLLLSKILLSSLNWSTTISLLFRFIFSFTLHLSLSSQNRTGFILNKELCC
jgi:hypothetical protein